MECGKIVCKDDPSKSLPLNSFDFLCQCLQLWAIPIVSCHSKFCLYRSVIDKDVFGRPIKENRLFVLTNEFFFSTPPSELSPLLRDLNSQFSN